MYLLRAVAIWFVIIAAETVHGILMRPLLLAPMVGEIRARQVAVVTGSILILAAAYFTVRWIKAETRIQLFFLGVDWVTLTVLFEFSLGWFVLNYSWNRLIEDYDLARGGLLGIGLLFMLFAPMLAQQLRKRVDR